MKCIKFAFVKTMLATLSLFGFLHGAAAAQGAWPPAKPSGQDWVTGVYVVGTRTFTIEWVHTTISHLNYTPVDLIFSLYSSNPGGFASVSVTGTPTPNPLMIIVPPNPNGLYSVGVDTGTPQSVSSAREGTRRGVKVALVAGGGTGNRSATFATGVEFFYKYKITQVAGSPLSSVDVRVAHGTMAHVLLWGAVGGGTAAGAGVARTKSVSIGPMNGPFGPSGVPAGDPFLTRDTDEFLPVNLIGGVGYFWATSSMHVPTDASSVSFGTLGATTTVEEEVIPLEVIK